MSETTPLDLVEVYRRRRKWRWRYKAAGNLKIMADGGEGYENLGELLNSMRRVLDLVPFPVNGEGHRRVPRRNGNSWVLVVFVR